MKNYFERALQNKYAIAVVVLCIGILISHLYYVSLTQQFPEQDEHLYLDIAVAFYKMCQNLSISTPVEMMQYLIAHPPIRQPLYSFTILFQILFVGLENTYKIALFENVLYYCASIVGVYILAQNYLGKRASFLASLVFATSGFPLFYLHFTYSETATTTFVVWSLVTLLKTDYFRSRRMSVLFGFFLCGALLTRWLSIAFIIGPLVYYIFLSIRQSTKNHKIIYKNLFLIVACLIPAILFYVFGSVAFLSYLWKNIHYGSSWMVADVAGSSASNPLSAQSAVFYLKIIEQQTIFYFVLFLIGIGISLVYFKKYAILILGFWVPYCILTFAIALKYDRFIVPIYPVASILSILFFDYIKGRIKSGIIFFLILIFCIGNFFGSIWAIGPLGSEGLKSALIPLPFGHPRRIHFNTMVWPPVRSVSNAQKIFSAITKDSTKTSPTVLILFSLHELDNGFYSLNAYHRVKRIDIQNYVGSPVGDIHATSLYTTNVLKNSDYILKKTNTTIKEMYPPENYIVLRAVIEEFSKSEKEIVSNYTILSHVEVPYDHSEVVIYKRVTPISQKVLNNFQKNVQYNLQQKVSKK